MANEIWKYMFLKVGKWGNEIAGEGGSEEIMECGVKEDGRRKC